jgi:hypothetical protein
MLDEVDNGEDIAKSLFEQTTQVPFLSQISLTALDNIESEGNNQINIPLNSSFETSTNYSTILLKNHHQNEIIKREHLSPSPPSISPTNIKQGEVKKTRYSRRVTRGKKDDNMFIYNFKKESKRKPKKSVQNNKNIDSNKSTSFDGKNLETSDCIYFGDSEENEKNKIKNEKYSDDEDDDDDDDDYGDDDYEDNDQENTNSTSLKRKRTNRQTINPVKKEMNKEAATKYRLKKISEKDMLFEKRILLEKENGEMKKRIELAYTEINYLKNLLVQMLLTKGIIGNATQLVTQK